MLNADVSTTTAPPRAGEPELRAGYRCEQRHAGAECERQLQLHAGCELHRRRQLRLLTDADSGETLTGTVTLTVNCDRLTVTDEAARNEDTVLNADVSTNDSTTSGRRRYDVSNGTLVLNANGSFNTPDKHRTTGGDSLFIR